MWIQGLFWGFVSKEQSEEVLEKCNAGVFLLRFSERVAGSIAVAYKQGPATIRHYLMKPADLAQGRTLPQWIRETKSLLFFLQITSGDDFQMKLNIVEKNSALNKIGGLKRQKNSSDEPKTYYDEAILDLLSQQIARELHMEDEIE